MSTYRVEHGDALAKIARLPDASIGAIVSDPPFGISTGRSGGGMGDDPWIGSDIGSVESAISWSAPFAAEFYRVVRRGGAVALMLGSQVSAAWLVTMESAGFVWMAEIAVLWNTGKPRRRNFGSLSTRVIWFARPGARHTWNTEAKSIYSNVLVVKKPPQQEKVHPAQKPVELTTFLVSLLSKEGDVILDPFCGSGSTLVSAAICDRDCIGIDADADYVKIARRRVANYEAEEEDDIFLWVNNRIEPV